MSSITDSLFGGSDDSAQKAQERANRETTELIGRRADEARQDAVPLFGAAQENRQLGAQAALDIFGQALPQQVDVFQQGNVGAQQALLSGLPQIQNAILGTGVDLSALQPQQLNVDTSIFQQQIPQFVQPDIPLTEQERELRTAQGVVPGITTREDLFRAASLGDIPNISQADRKFFGAALGGILGTPSAASTRFVDNPGDRSFVGQAGGFNAANERKLANLLTQFQGIGG